MKREKRKGPGNRPHFRPIPDPDGWGQMLVLAIVIFLVVGCAPASKVPYQHPDVNWKESNWQYVTKAVDGSIHYYIDIDSILSFNKEHLYVELYQSTSPKSIFSIYYYFGSEKVKWFSRPVEHHGFALPPVSDPVWKLVGQKNVVSDVLQYLENNRYLWGIINTK